MPTTRTLDGSVRTGALLAGIPLLIAGLIPYRLEPLAFLWGTPDNLADVKLLAPAAAGILLIAIGVIPGLPRLLRGLFILGLSGAAMFLVADAFVDAAPMRFNLEDERDLVLLGTILLAAVGEMWSQGFKTSKVFALIAFIGWLAYLAQGFIPWDGGEPLAINLVESVADVIDGGNFDLPILARVTPIVILLLSFLLALNGALFAFLRLVRGTTGMLRGPFKSAWAAILIAGMFGLMFLVAGLLAAIDDSNITGILIAVGVGMMFFGVGVGVASGLAHTVLGVIPAPRGGEDMARPVYQPESAAAGPSALPQSSMSQFGPKTPAQPQFQQQPAQPAFQESRPAQSGFAGGGGGGWQQPGGSGGAGGGFGGQPAFGSGGGAQGGFGGGGGSAAQGGFGGGGAAQDGFGGGSAGGGGWAQAQPPASAGFGGGGASGGGAAGGGWAQAQPPAQPQSRPQDVGGFGAGAAVGAGAAPAGWEQGPTAINPRVTSNLPRGAELQAYPGYPGYVVCPQCRGGVATNSPKCSHCGQQIAW